MTSYTHEFSDDKFIVDQNVDSVIFELLFFHEIDANLDLFTKVHDEMADKNIDMVMIKFPSRGFYYDKEQGKKIKRDPMFFWYRSNRDNIKITDVLDDSSYIVQCPFNLFKTFYYKNIFYLVKMYNIKDPNKADANGWIDAGKKITKLEHFNKVKAHLKQMQRKNKN